MKIAYISGKYRAKTEIELERNIDLAREYALKYWNSGFAVICPHSNTAHFGGAAPDEVWLEGDFEFLRRMNQDGDVIVMIPGWGESEGAKLELDLAKELGIQVIYEAEPEYDTTT